MLYVFGLEFHVDCEFGVHSLFRCEVIKLTSRNFRLGMRILYMECDIWFQIGIERRIRICGLFISIHFCLQQKSSGPALRY